ncbi:MAG: hypothetical protein KF708_21580 [Pirellulales bacterium]|nr:hypothetical protein [Pirellulales bacterium]
MLRIPLSGRASGAAAARGRSRDAAMRPFVVGNENRVAAVAVLAALPPARQPYNPLVFCGAPGLGKSHLLSGLVAEHRRLLPATQVVQIVAVDFAREYAEAIDVQSLDEFRPRVRDVRVLAIEDVHLIAGKNMAQEELCRTIDAVRDAGGLVLVSLRHAPAETRGLIPALAARLDAGLVVTLAPPDEPSRRELLDDLAAERGVQLSPAARDLLARQLAASPRELEAALVQLSAIQQEHAVDEGAPIEESLAHTLLDSRAETVPLAIDSLARASAKYFAEHLEQVRGPSRRRGVTLARSMGMYLARRWSGASLSEIGRYYGGRDHTTVLHACGRIASELAQDRSLAEAAHEICKLARRDQWHKQNRKNPPRE